MPSPHRNASLAGTSGFGNPDADDYVTILHARRFAYVRGSGGYNAPELLRTVVASAGIPTNLGAGTDEDVALVVERNNVLLLGGEP